MTRRSAQIQPSIGRGLAGRGFRQGAKIDNLVQIAHNVVVGKNTVIAAQTGIAGSVRIGERVMIGGQAGITGHVEIGDDTAIGAQSGVSKSISGGVWRATPAVKLAEAQEQLAWVRRLGKFFARLREIEKENRAMNKAEIRFGNRIVDHGWGLIRTDRAFGSEKLGPLRLASLVLIVIIVIMAK